MAYYFLYSLRLKGSENALESYGATIQRTLNYNTYRKLPTCMYVCIFVYTYIYMYSLHNLIRNYIGQKEKNAVFIEYLLSIKPLAEAVSTSISIVSFELGIITPNLETK